MRKLAIALALSLLCIPMLARAANLATPRPAALLQDNQGNYDNSSYIPYSPDQLDNLLAPIALYPDPLLAQVLPATTFVDEIDAAARWVQANGEYGIEYQPWDVSVKAVAHYPEVLNMLDANLDWTTSVGQAYVYQSTDVMESIQRLRSMAYAQGNLVTNSQWQIVDQGGYIQIWPESPQYIYVPTYDPNIVYDQRAYFGGGYGDMISFGSGFAIGVWLNRDTDWRDHRVYYTGWRGHNDWEARSRQYIHENNVYVNNQQTNIVINRTVINRSVNISNVNTYTSVHRNVNFDNVAPNRNNANQKYQGNQNPGNNQRYQAPKVDNRVINRNIDTSNPRLNQFRGHQTPQPQPARPQPYRPTPQPYRQAPTQPVRPAEPVRQQQARPQQPYRATPQPYRPTPQPYRQPVQQARPAPPPRPGPHGFGRSEGAFSARTASQRGQASRQQMSRPAPRPAPGRPAPSRPQPKRPGRPRGRR